MQVSDLFKTTLAEPRCYQTRIVENALGHYDDGITSLLVNSPTGSGKTVMGLAIARALQERYNIGVGWFAMRRNLLSQVVRANQDMQMGVDCLTPISMFDKNPPLKDAVGRPIELLIIDEAQHDAASSMGQQHNRLRPKYTLGLSATPFRTDKLKLCFQKVIRDAGIHQLIGLGFLSKFHHFVIPRWDVATVTQRYLAEPERWGKTAMYWHKQSNAVACVERLRAAGVRADIVLGSQTHSHRESVMARFESGELDVLVNLFVLTEGWDCPSLKTVFVRDSVRGPTIQMAGRVFRKHPDHAVKQVVQSEHSKWPMVRTATPAMSYVWMDAEWRSVTPSETANNVVKRMHQIMVRLPTTSLPAFLTKKQKPVKRRAVGME